MNLPHDLKHYSADDLGAFQFFDGDECVGILCAIIFACCVFPELCRI